MKRILLLLLVAILAGPFLLAPLVGISPLALREALAVGTGLTAKLACSGYYLSGFDDQRNLDDIASYNSAARAVTMRHAQPNRIETDIYGLAPASARYYPGLGCTLEYPDMIDLAALEVPTLPDRQGPWPAGEKVGATDPEVQQVLDEILAADAESGLDTRALLVVKDSQVVAETYKDGIGTDTPLLGWSMGKSVASILLGRMEALDMLAVDDAALFADWQSDERRDISLENLLQMSSGLDFDEPYVPGSDSTRMLFMAPSASGVALESPLLYEPGSQFYYSSGTSNLLMRIAWDQLGADTQALLNFFAREISAPLGLGNTTLELDASGVYVGSSYVYAPARDWARLGLLMINDGRVDEQRLLPEGWVTRASAPNSSTNEPRYGYQFWLNAGGEEPRWPRLEEGAYAMLGNRGQVVMMLPEHDAVVVRLGWSATDYPTGERVGRIQTSLEQANTREPVPPPPAES